MAILTRGKVSNNGNVVTAIFSRIYMISSDGNLADGRQIKPSRQRVQQPAYRMLPIWLVLPRKSDPRRLERLYSPCAGPPFLTTLYLRIVLIGATIFSLPMHWIMPNHDVICGTRRSGDSIQSNLTSHNTCNIFTSDVQICIEAMCHIVGQGNWKIKKNRNKYNRIFTNGVQNLYQSIRTIRGKLEDKKRKEIKR